MRDSNQFEIEFNWNMNSEKKTMRDSKQELGYSLGERVHILHFSDFPFFICNSNLNILFVGH